MLWNFKSDSPLNSATDNKRILIKVYLCADQLNSMQKNIRQKNISGCIFGECGNFIDDISLAHVLQELVNFCNSSKW